MVFSSVALMVWCWQLPPSVKRIEQFGVGKKDRKSLPPATLLAILWPLAGAGLFGFTGFLITFATIPLVRAWVVKLDRAADRQRAARISADLPVALNLIAAVVKAGRSTESAFALVSRHLNDPIGSEFQQISRQLAGSADPRQVWWGLNQSFFGKVARSFARSADSGSSVVLAVTHAADDVRKERQELKKVAASRVAVKTAAPLGLCFLPAFLLVGIVPMILGVSSGIFGS